MKTAIILDEPTEVLTPAEVNYLLNILRQLAGNNHTIIFISHKLEEVINVSDIVTVLRRGKVVDTIKTAATTTHKLAEMMVGREVNLIPQKIAAEKGNIVLEVKNIEVKNDRGLSCCA